jgi:hypothetical protein
VIAASDFNSFLLCVLLLSVDSDASSHPASRSVSRRGRVHVGCWRPSCRSNFLSVLLFFFLPPRVVSSLPFSTSFLSIPRCVTPTEKGYAIGLDGLILLYEFKSSNTLYVGPAEFTDSAGEDLRKYEERLEFESREQELLDSIADEERQAKRRCEEDGLFQTSLFERFHHLRDSTAPKVARPPLVPIQVDKPRESFDVFLAKSIPVFRPVPGHPPPATQNIPSILAAQSAATPLASGVASPRRGMAAPTIAPGLEIFCLQSMACSPDRHALVLTSKTREIVSIKLKGQ